jgi:hypothetical protein
MEFKVYFDRFSKFKVCFEPNKSFGTKRELAAKLEDENWTFFFYVLFT